MKRVSALLAATLFAAAGLVASVPPAGTAAAQGESNRFHGNFDLLEYFGTTVVAHIVVDVVEPTEAQLVPGSVDIYWSADSPVRESHGQIVSVGFFTLEDDPTEGPQLGVVIEGSLCDYMSPQVGICQPFAMVFVDTVDPAYLNHVSLNVPCCGEAAWFDVGRGAFVMRWVRETP